ncbi:hypothetical protein DRO59_00520 [Candidatus Bathyarchaeota archaeon]|nr:MAG: hypothetical protein DRO59_00520 [Candidatus Bathyarchaeota archaeon]
MSKIKEKPQEEPITKEELETPVEKLVAKRAEELYKAETKKDWRKEPPEEEKGKEYVRRAAKQILAKWVKGAREYHTVVETVFGAPPERRMTLVKIGKKVELLPTEEILKPSKLPPNAVLKCPKCKALAMVQIAPGIWQCKNCYKVISTLYWFPRRKYPTRRRR